MKRIYFATIIFLFFPVFVIGCVSNDFSRKKKMQVRKLIKHDDFIVGIDAISSGTYTSEFEYMTFSWDDKKIYKDIRIIEAGEKNIIIYHDADGGEDFFMPLEKADYLSFVKEVRSILELCTVAERLPEETSGYSSGIESFVIRFTGDDVQNESIVVISLAMLKSEDYRYRLRELFENLSVTFRNYDF